MREVAIVQVVLWSKVLRIRRRSRIWEKQDFEMWNMIRKRKIRIKDNTKISSRRNRLYCCIWRNCKCGIVNFGKLYWKPNEKKFSFSRVERQKVWGHPWRNVGYTSQYFARIEYFLKRHQLKMIRKVECHQHRAYDWQMIEILLNWVELYRVRREEDQEQNLEEHHREMV